MSKRKLLPSIYNLFCDNVSAGQKFSILGFDRSEMGDEEYRSLVKDALRHFGEGDLRGEMGPVQQSSLLSFRAFRER